MRAPTRAGLAHPPTHGREAPGSDRRLRSAGLPSPRLQELCSRTPGSDSGDDGGWGGLEGTPIVLAPLRLLGEAIKAPAGGHV